MRILEVENLVKKYPGFELKNVSFSLEKGKITGFIGRNGAGKTTTLKSIMNFLHYDGGTIKFFGKSSLGNELEIKQRIGFVTGGIDYYSGKKIKVITDVTKKFYSAWDESAYSRYMTLFQLDENKTPAQLSQGMKVKYALVLALSHNAELLILDEPTSGLDPVSRDELLDIFLELCDKGITILFSTHITTDLDKCADHIVYIKNGQILADDILKNFVEGYRVIDFINEQIPEQLKGAAIGLKRTKEGTRALFEYNKLDGYEGMAKPADLEAIMVHMEKEAEE